MTNQYTWIGWNRHKKVYDALLWAGIVAFMGIFIAFDVIRHGDSAADPMVLLIRATGLCALVLMHIILCIGPLARLSTRWNPILYNRRHLGVSMCLLALSHAILTILYYHSFSPMNPLASVLVNSTRQGVGFELFGALALIIIFLMGATSHDFWLHTLSPYSWKWLHMGVYLAYGLLLLHVGLGALQEAQSPLGLALLAIGAVTITLLHVLAGTLERIRDARGAAPIDGWIDVGAPNEIPSNRARVVCLQNAERVAVFRYGGKISAVSNICAHQAGPLGEGTVVDGCITCPWHGYQYRPEDGQSPPPYTERVETYEVRIEGGRVLLNPEAKPKGTRLEPARIDSAHPEAGEQS